MRTDAQREAARKYKHANRDKVRAWNKGYYQRNKKKIIELNKKWRANNPGYRSAWRQKSLAYQQSKKKTVELNTLKEREKREKLAKRDYTEICDICGNKSESRRNAFDHCHKTGVFRGWLCFRCNSTLGKVEDNPDLLVRMADYLRKYQ